MLFVKADDLKPGMRLARPIYNRSGTLLYERDSKLTQQGIISVHNFGLIGVYILEPAEPVPPMTKEDLEFERFQTISVFTLKDELGVVANKGDSKKLTVLANQIVKQYGNLYHKINFMQNLRSKADYIYKHSLNTGILCALISQQMDFTYEEQVDVVMAALLHDIYKLSLPEELVEREFRNQSTDENQKLVRKGIMDAQEIIKNYASGSPNVKKIVKQFYNHVLTSQPIEPNDIMRGTKVLRVAEAYDNLTAMKSYTEPTSEVSALRALQADKKLYDEEMVVALTESIHILSPGTSVTLTNHDKGIVIVENHRDVLRPVVISYRTNEMMDLGLKSTFGKVQVLDVMKTMDNRFVMDQDMVKEFFDNDSNSEKVMKAAESKEKEAVTEEIAEPESDANEAAVPEKESAVEQQEQEDLFDIDAFMRSEQESVADTSQSDSNDGTDSFFDSFNF